MTDDIAGQEVRGACSPATWRANPAEVAATLDSFYEEEDEEVIAFDRSICAGCGARAQCLEIALSRNEKYGIWGGTTPAERKGLRQSRKTNYRPTERGI